MKQWRNILERGDYIGSFKGLDKLALKPEIPSEQEGLRLAYEGGLVYRRELRTEEEYLKSFTPFVNKKDAASLTRMRKGLFEPNCICESLLGSFNTAERTEAEAVRDEEEYPAGAEAVPASVSEAESSEGESLPAGFTYEGQEEDSEFFDEMQPEEIARVYKERRVEALSLALQMADTFREKKVAYDALREEMTKPGPSQVSEEEFVDLFGGRPIPPAAASVGGAGGGGAGHPADSLPSPEEEYERFIDKLAENLQMAYSLSDKQKAYDALKAEFMKPGKYQMTPEEFVETWGRRPGGAFTALAKGTP